MSNDPAGLYFKGALNQVFRSRARYEVTKKLLGSLSQDSIVDLKSAKKVLLLTSHVRAQFCKETYSCELAMHKILTEKGIKHAVVDSPEHLFEKEVFLTVPHNMVAPSLSDQSEQVYQLTQGLEKQGNVVFRSSDEVKFWENKAYMHEQFFAHDIPSPESVIVSRDTYSAAHFPPTPLLIKAEHSCSSQGIYHMATEALAREFLKSYEWKPGERLIVQTIVVGATKDLRLTYVGDDFVPGATYWRIKSKDAIKSGKWVITATSYNSSVLHGDIPIAEVKSLIKQMRSLGLRTGGLDVMWPNDDLSQEPKVLEVSPFYQPNPPKPASFDGKAYKEFKKTVLGKESYICEQHKVFLDICRRMVDQGFF